MAPLIALPYPCPAVNIRGIDITATEAVRTDAGISATLMAVNGNGKALRLVALPDHRQRRQFAEEVASFTTLNADEVERAVVGLAPEIEARFRQGPPPAAEWAPPVPFHSAALPAFPTDVLPERLRTYVESLATSTQTPVDLPAMLVLAALSTACARVLVVQPRADWQEPPNLFIAAALESGNRKSTVVAEVTVPLVAWEEAKAQTEGPAVAEAATRHKILEAQLAQAQALASKAEPGEKDRLTDDAVSLARQLAQTTLPTVPRLAADEVTPERLATLQRDNGGAIGLLTAEGGEIFDIAGGRYSSSPNLGVFLKGHAGDPLRIDRVGRAAEYVRFPRLTIGMAVQPDVLRGLGATPSMRGRGLLARFLYTRPASLLGRRDVEPPSVPAPVRAAYAEDIAALLRLSPAGGDDGAVCLNVVKFDAGAQERLRDFMKWIEPQLSEYGDLGLLADWGGKLAGAVVRVASLLHAAEHLACPWATAVTADTVDAAIQIGKYLIPHARAVFAEMGADPETDGARHVLAWIERTGAETFSKRDLYQGVRGRFKTVAAVDPALKLLVTHEFIRERPAEERQPGKAGRKPGTTYDVNPTGGNFEDCGDFEDSYSPSEPRRRRVAL